VIENKFSFQLLPLFLPAFLHSISKTLQFAPMKFALAILVYLIIAVILGAGILLVMAGKPWFLAIGVVAFVVAFGRIGCMPR
jgi:membrane protein YdbS with pleckstrin-like domain